MLFFLADLLKKSGSYSFPKSRIETLLFGCFMPVDIICVVQKCPKQRWDMMGSYFPIAPGRNQWRAAQGGGESSEFEMFLAMACYFDDLKTGFRSFNS